MLHPENGSVEHPCSKTIFGGKHRLALFTELCRRESVTSLELADEFKRTPTEITRELSRLAETGVLIRRSRAKSTDPIIYDRNPDINWEVIEAALGEVWKLSEQSADSGS